MGALPNLFDDVITQALDDPDATPESVAAVIACSELFLRAIRIGMAHVPPPVGVPTIAQKTRLVLGAAFSAATAGTMFPRAE